MDPLRKHVLPRLVMPRGTRAACSSLAPPALLEIESPSGIAAEGKVPLDA